MGCLKGSPIRKATPAPYFAFFFTFFPAAVFLRIPSLAEGCLFGFEKHRIDARVMSDDVEPLFA